MKTKTQISCAVALQLISAFVLATRIVRHSSTHIQNSKLLACFCDYTVLDLVGTHIVGFLTHRLIFTAGNVVRGNRKVMQSECSREHPNMIYGIRQNVNSQMSFHELYFYTVLQLYINKKENTIPFNIYVCIRNE